MAINAIEIKNVYKRFDNAAQNAVDGVSADIPAGSFITVMGTSGSGKTTLLKAINRIYEITAGDILFFGENIKGLKVEEYRKKIGYVIQQIGLFPHMTVAENIAMVPKTLKWNRKRTDERIEYLLDLVHLPSWIYKNRYPRQLSGGQQQRVGLARAMAADPAVMLMDEPFGAIDAITRQTLQNELLQIQRQLRKTILFVTHDIREAFKLGDKVIIMNEGRIQQYDTPYNIMFNPVNSYVNQLVSCDDVLDRLNVLRAEHLLSRLEAPPCADDICVKKEEPLNIVLGIFIQKGIPRVVVTDDNESAVGQINWNKFQEIPVLRKG